MTKKLAEKQRPRRKTRNLSKQKVFFRQRVLEIVRRIRAGQTFSYKEVAAQAGNIKAARAVGAILRTNYDPHIPCHRVIRLDGSLGGYNRGVARKKILIEEEKNR